MNLELKHISIKSVIFSAYPLIVVVFSLMNTLLAGMVDFDIAVSLFTKVMKLSLWTISETLAILLLSVIAAFAYNFFCSIGMKGLRFTIEEIEEDIPQTEQENQNIN